MNKKEIWVTEALSAPVLWRAGLDSWEQSPRAPLTSAPKPRLRSPGDQLQKLLLGPVQHSKARASLQAEVTPDLTHELWKSSERLVGDQRLLYHPKFPPTPDFLQQKRDQEISEISLYSLSLPHPESCIVLPWEGKRENMSHSWCLQRGVLCHISWVSFFWLLFLYVFRVSWAPITDDWEWEWEM